MMRKVSVIAAALACLAGPALAAGGAKHPEHVGYSFDGPFGKFDQAQLQRGFKVYKEVCADCHSADLLYFRNLGQKGGPFYDAEYRNPNDNPFAKAVAAEYEVDDIDSESGDVIPRKATTADRWPAPYPNEAAARAGNDGAMPPDLSVIAKARHGGADYIYSLLAGYVATPPAGLAVDENRFYNPNFPGDLTSAWTGQGHVPVGGIIAMPPPLEAGKVTFDDGTPSTVRNQAKDVAAFLAWLSDPKATERKQTGIVVMIYLLLLTGLTYASYRRVWRNESH